jgi:Tol biopolymer transport system component
MKRFIVVLGIACVLLAACGQTAQAPTASPKEKPLFTDADVDKAQLQATTPMKELVGIDDGTAPEGRDIPALQSAGEISPQLVLPNAAGFVFYIEYFQSFVGGTPPYSLYRHNQRTDARDLLYSGERYIQSVAGSADGNMVVVSMKETTDQASDLDLYLFNVSDLANPAIFLLSFDGVDNTNVSMSADSSRIVSEELISGKASVVLRTKQPFAGYTGVILSQSNPQRQPSISGNGQYISLVRDLADGRDRVVRYNVVSHSYLGVATSTRVLEYPSVSDDGNKVLWLANGTSDLVRLKDIAAATTQTVLTEVSISHPFMTSDGRFMAYGSGRSIVTKNLSTGQTQTIASSITRLMSFYAPMWQMPVFPSVLETQKVPRFLPFGEFGAAVGVEGDFMVVGEPDWNNGLGAAYILQRNSSGVWSIVRVLLAEDGEAGDSFGSAVSISGDTVIVGAPSDDHPTACDITEGNDVGAAYVFQKNQGGSNQWGQVRKIVGEGGCDENFGTAVDIAGDTAVVGTRRDAFIFLRNTGGTNAWGRTKKLVPAEFASGFGESVSVSFDTVVVGTSVADAAYVFLRNQGGSGNWGQVKKLVPSDSVPFSSFGRTVAISQNTIVVGDPEQNVDINHNGGLECNETSDECAVGAAYVFERNQGGTEAWGQVKKLLASDLGSFDKFGGSVAIWGDLLVVGARSKPNGDFVGAAYVFGRFQSGMNAWGQTKKLVASDGTSGAAFGTAVSISGSRVAVGASGEEAVYIYE